MGGARKSGMGMGWVEPYFRDLETDQDYPDPPHGSSGPVPITRFKDKELIPIQRAFRDGCRTVGLADLADFNNSDNEGVGPWPMNRIETTRISAATAFLDEARSRPNLTIRQNTLVNRVVLDGKRAVAVELSDGEVLEAEGIVLSAGAFGSPAILLRSGIGPAREVAALGITSRIDLPGVGARLWDHASVPIRLVPKPGQCVPGHDPRFQLAAGTRACFPQPLPASRCPPPPPSVGHRRILEGCMPLRSARTIRWHRSALAMYYTAYGAYWHEADLTTYFCNVRFRALGMPDLCGAKLNERSWP